MRNDVITPASGQYFFWIRTKVKSLMFCEPPQGKLAFYKEVQKTLLPALNKPNYQSYRQFL